MLKQELTKCMGNGVVEIETVKKLLDYGKQCCKDGNSLEIDKSGADHVYGGVQIETVKKLLN